MKPSVYFHSCLAGALSLAALFSVQAQDAELPKNLGGGWRKLQSERSDAVKNQQAQASAATPAHASRFQQDQAGRVVVDVTLDGTVPMETVQASLEALGGNMVGVEKAGHSLSAPNGMLSMQLPVSAAAAAAKVPGVSSISLVHRPWRHAH
jgi:hypothetical protein